MCRFYNNVLSNIDENTRTNLKLFLNYIITLQNIYEYISNFGETYFWICLRRGCERLMICADRENVRPAAN